MTYDAKELKKNLKEIVWLMNMLDDINNSCCGISLAQCHALMEIGEARTISLNLLADRLNLDKSTLSRTVHSLVTHGYCEREEQTDDRRFIAIRLTQPGIALYEKIIRSIDEYFDTVYHTIPEEKRKQVVESAELLLGALKETNCCR